MNYPACVDEASDGFTPSNNNTLLPQGLTYWRCLTTQAGSLRQHQHFTLSGQKLVLSIPTYPKVGSGANSAYIPAFGQLV